MKGITRTDIAIWLILLAYVISPIDILPDAIPIAGTADDALLTLIALIREKFSSNS